MQVDHQNALRHPDLNRGKPDTGRVVHRLEHISDKLFQLGVEGLDGLGNDAQPRIRGLYDG
ncbi:aminotransferase [Sphingopyxis sp. EG6]|nr:aminotransferase [Sphingopyxis sp. EG6]